MHSFGGFTATFEGRLDKDSALLDVPLERRRAIGSNSHWTAARASAYCHLLSQALGPQTFDIDMEQLVFPDCGVVQRLVCPWEHFHPLVDVEGLPLHEATRSGLLLCKRPAVATMTWDSLDCHLCVDGSSKDGSAAWSVVVILHDFDTAATILVGYLDPLYANLVLLAGWARLGWMPFLRSRWPSAMPSSGFCRRVAVVARRGALLSALTPCRQDGAQMARSPCQPNRASHCLREDLWSWQRPTCSSPSLFGM